MRLFGNAFKNIYGSLTLASPSGQTALNVQDSAGSIIGNPSGGPQGANTLNVQNGIYVNGTPVGGSTVNANSLVGTTLASGVVNSSLTSVGTLSAGSVPTSLLSGTFPAGNLSGSALPAGIVTSSLTAVGAVTSGSFPAANLSGGTLASGVTASSLTSVGAITSGSFPAANLSGATLAGGVTASSLTSVGTLSALGVTGTVTAGGFSTAGGVASATATISGQSQEGSTLVGSPTGGNKGAGSINAQSIFVNGVAVGGSSNVTTVFKNADTVRTSTATLADDPDLQISLAASGIYAVTIGMCFDTTSGSNGFKWGAYTTAALTNDNSNIWWANAFAFNQGSSTLTTSVSAPCSSTASISSASPEQVVTTFMANVSGATSLRVQWCQITSGSPGATLRKGSYITVTKIA